MRTVAMLAVLSLVACGRLKSPTEPSGGAAPDPAATFTRVQNEIFTPTCTQIGCHDTIGRQSQLVLVAGASYDAIVGRPSVEMPQLMRVAPVDPAASYLYRKVTGSGIAGERMPAGLPPLSEVQLALIRDWIRRGAPND